MLSPAQTRQRRVIRRAWLIFREVAPVTGRQSVTSAQLLAASALLIRSRQTAIRFHRGNPDERNEYQGIDVAGRPTPRVYFAAAAFAFALAAIPHRARTGHHRRRRARLARGWPGGRPGRGFRRRRRRSRCRRGGRRGERRSRRSEPWLLTVAMAATATITVRSLPLLSVIYLRIADVIPGRAIGAHPESCDSRWAAGCSISMRPDDVFGPSSECSWTAVARRQFFSR